MDPRTHAARPAPRRPKRRGRVDAPATSAASAAFSEHPAERDLFLEDAALAGRAHGEQGDARAREDHANDEELHGFGVAPHVDLDERGG